MKTKIFILMLHSSIWMHSSTQRTELLARPLILYGSSIQEATDQLSPTNSLYNISPLSTPNQSTSSRSGTRSIQQFPLGYSVIVSPRSTPDQEVDQQPAVTIPIEQPVAPVQVNTNANAMLAARESKCECVCAYLKYVIVTAAFSTCIAIHLYNLDHHKPI